MSERLLRDTKLLKQVKKIYSENGLLDIILFGSSVRGKSHPADLDILVLFSKKIDDSILPKIELVFRKREYDVEITAATYRDLLSPKFLPRETIFDGISLISMEKISKAFGYRAFVLFRYSIKGFTNSQRVKFFYSIQGRYRDGLLKEMGYRIGRDTFLIFSESSEKFKAFLEKWKVDYQEIELLIPERRENLLKALNGRA